MKNPGTLEKIPSVAQELSSGKRVHSYGQSPSLMDRINYFNGHVQKRTVTNYQRVYNHQKLLRKMYLYL